jgi:hypothetical protein
MSIANVNVKSRIVGVGEIRRINCSTLVVNRLGAVDCGLGALLSYMCYAIKRNTAIPVKSNYEHIDSVFFAGYS